MENIIENSRPHFSESQIITCKKITVEFQNSNKKTFRIRISLEFLASAEKIRLNNEISHI